MVAVHAVAACSALSALLRGSAHNHPVYARMLHCLITICLCQERTFATGCK
jgi:hypothetical protein